MIRQFNWKKKIIALLVLISILLTGCGREEEKLNSYSLEEIRGNQVVFAYEYANLAWTNDCFVWIYNKYGQCKVIDLMENPEVEQNDEKRYLANLDAYMADDKVPFLESKLELTDERISYCINLTKIKLNEIYGGTSFDASGETFYVVLGVKDKRQLKVMEDSDVYGFYKSENEILQEVCQAIDNASEFPE